MRRWLDVLLTGIGLVGLAALIAAVVILVVCGVLWFLMVAI